MGTSTDGILFYGALLEDEAEFPWSESETIEDWWLYNVCEFKHEQPIYDLDGNYLDGVEPTNEAYELYFQELREARKKYPMPVELVTHCSGDYPMYAICFPNTEITASRGRPLSIDINDFGGTEHMAETVSKFCARFNLEIDKPNWYLASYWG